MAASVFEASVGSLSFDDGRVIRDVDEAGATLLGRARAELVGQALSAILPLAARVFFDAHVLPLLALNGRVDSVYVMLLGAGNRSVPVLLNAMRVERPTGARTDCTFVAVQGRRLLLARELAWAARDADDAKRG